MRLGNIAAGLICGAATIIPGRVMVEGYAQSMVIFVDEGSFALLAWIAPVLLVVLALLVCVPAPTLPSAWLRGSILVAAIAVMGAVYVGQCAGMAYAFRQWFDDPLMAREMEKACPAVPSLMVMVATGVLALAGAIGAVLAWREVKKGETLEY